MASLLRQIFNPHDRVLALEGSDLDKAIARQVGSDALQYTDNLPAALALPLPPPTDCCEDWIHIERGPHGRWILRLMRSYRADPSQPWASREVYVADADEEPVPLATAYGRAWLYSYATWPVAERECQLAS
jgi:hypothetical protein